MGPVHCASPSHAVDPVRNGCFFTSAGAPLGPILGAIDSLLNYFLRLFGPLGDVKIENLSNFLKARATA